MVSIWCPSPDSNARAAPPNDGLGADSADPSAPSLPCLQDRRARKSELHLAPKAPRVPTQLRIPKRPIASDEPPACDEICHQLSSPMIDHIFRILPRRRRPRHPMPTPDSPARSSSNPPEPPAWSRIPTVDAQTIPWAKTNQRNFGRLGILAVAPVR